MKDVVKSKLICPKCKSKDLYIREIWHGHLIEWKQTNGIFDINDGNSDVGNPAFVEATCIGCDHSWKVRKAIQITGIINIE